MRSTLRRPVAAVLVPAMIFAALALPATAGEPPIQITVGQPNIWSLEQAHYLLAQMHERSAELKAKLPGEDILDPAGIQGQTFDFLRTAVSADLSFDQTVGVANQLELETFQHESTRRRSLQAQLDAARARQATLVTEIAQLESRRTTMASGVPAGTTTPELATLDATLASRKAEKGAVDGQVNALIAELATLASDPELESSSPGTTATLPTHGLATFLAGLQLGAPKLHPSVILDNFVQFQYEIIAKQLSLLRDELNEGERLVFLELPHAVYPVPRKADDYLVRTSWQVEGYFTLPDEKQACPGGVARKSESERTSREQAASECQEDHEGDTQRNVLSRAGESLSGFPNRRPLLRLQDQKSCWFDLQPAPREAGSAEWSPDATLPEEAYRRARVLDLIPRTLAVNLDATTASSKAIDLGLNVGTLGGVGAGLALQRQHDLADRLVEQQVFAAGFGRGDLRFSWVFAPPPASRSLHPGDKTTYAVVAIPEEAVMLRLQAEKCTFHRSLDPGHPFKKSSTSFLSRWWRHCEDGMYFDLRVPGHSRDQFFVEEVAYSGVAPGEMLAVTVRGHNFSPQTGILVNGTPLRRSLSLAAEAIVPPESSEPYGFYEIVNSEAVVLSFSMPAGYFGTPLISLVSPGKVAPINYYTTIRINGAPGPLSEYSKHHPMFRPAPEITSMRLVSKIGANPPVIEVLGSGFRDGVSVSWFLNSEAVLNRHFHTPRQVRLELPPTAATASEWRIRYVDGSTQGYEEVTFPVKNLLSPRVTELEVIGVDKDAKGKITGYEVLFAVGGGFVPKSIRPIDAAIHRTVEKRGDGKYFAAIAASELPSVLEVCPTVHPVVDPTVCHLFSVPAKSAPPPQVHIVRPASVAVETKDSTVVLRGAHFGSVQEVLFGTVAAKILDRKGPTELLVQVPESTTPGPVRIRLTGDDNGKPVNNDGDLEALFTYEPAKK